VSDDSASNAYEFSVSELAQSLKRTIEDTYGHVRVRGELGRVTIAKSGHCYLDIKDEKAVINSIIWKGTMNRLAMRPEEGMEVIVEGRLSTYPGRSNYQLIIEKLELAGEGALMALFEKRKKMFAAEGLFATERKRDLPFMPQVIGVVTSPTGAVIRDILHRIEDRFPVHVILWPVLVQGDKAAEQIAGAITGFNHAEGFPRPDVLIVGRGGGSLEDLWCFNEEIVVRALANSHIPTISAVGHETDWTLADYVADYRAPTPTGAAEVAVPVLHEWVTTLEDYGVRLTRGLSRSVTEKKTRLSASRLPRIENLLGGPRQRLDVAGARLGTPGRLLESAVQTLAAIKLPRPNRIFDPAIRKLELAGARLRPSDIQRNIMTTGERVQHFGSRADRIISARLERMEDRLKRASGLLEAYSYQGVLKRGYALVTNEKGKVIRSKDEPSAGDAVTLTFADGDRAAVISGGAAITSTKVKTKANTKNRSGANQGDLF
jgi:exodeoxyribonuclease VII large subunit